ncbi:MAG: hypothetical protein Q4F23_00770 [Coriobacteriia bacterium]|nr:hypothetical protein [Coriobacteriia bacterium]
MAASDYSKEFRKSGHTQKHGALGLLEFELEDGGFAAIGRRVADELSLRQIRQ